MKKNILIAVLLIIMSIGCDKKPENLAGYGHDLTGIEASQILKKEMLADSFVSLDSGYACPTKKWILNDFSMAFRGELFRKGMLTYKPEKNDCDNFAINALAFAKACNLATPLSGRRDLLSGMLVYVQDSGSGHAINIFVYYENSKYNIMYYEPQTQKEVFLSADEKRNVVLCLF